MSYHCVATGRNPFVDSRTGCQIDSHPAQLATARYWELDSRDVVL